MQNKETSEKRKAQLRESQRRRRIMLAGNDRHQLNLYLSEKAIAKLDKDCQLSGLDRHDWVEQLILSEPTNPNSGRS